MALVNDKNSKTCQLKAQPTRHDQHGIDNLEPVRKSHTLKPSLFLLLLSCSAAPFLAALCSVAVWLSTGSKYYASEKVSLFQRRKREVTITSRSCFWPCSTLLSPGCRTYLPLEAPPPTIGLVFASNKNTSSMLRYPSDAFGAVNKH